MPDGKATFYRAMDGNMSAARTYSDPGLRKALAAAGGIRPLARALGISHVAVLNWTRVPYKHIVRIEEVTGVPREVLRPELYRVPHHGTKKAPR